MTTKGTTHNKHTSTCTQELRAYLDESQCMDAVFVGIELEGWVDDEIKAVS